MVRGLNKFRSYFEEFSQNYVVIGGTACDIIISSSGFKPRATKDIDIVLVIEALDLAFAKQFWNFVNDGKYEVKEKSNPEHQYYRFMNPRNEEFPYQIELFSRIPDILDIPEISRYVPIPIDEDIASLSAILLNEEYYHITIAGSDFQNGIRFANTETLICLKAKAYLDLKKAKERGMKVDSDKINKHKLDVFRLAVFLTEESKFDMPDSIKSDMQVFIELVKSDLPGNAIFKAMGLQNVSEKEIISLLIRNYNLKA